MRTRLAVAALLLLILTWIGSGLRLTSDLSSLLPPDGAAARSLRVLERFHIADTLLIEVDGRGVPQEELLAATDALGGALASDPRFATVRWRVGASDGVTLQRVIGPHAVDLIPAAQLQRRLAPEGIRAILRQQLLRLSGPGGTLFERQFLADPLDLSGLAAEQLRGQGRPFNIQVRDAHFLDKTGQRAVIFAEPAANIMQVGPQDPLTADLEALLDACPLPTRYLGGRRIAADAAQRMATDVQRAAGLGMIVLIGVVALGFRSLRPVVGALIPLSLAGATTIAAASLAGPLHGINLGFSAALLGLAVDYWIHLYVTAAVLPPARGFAERVERAQTALHEIRPALILGATSTMAAFSVLGLSHFPVLRNLGITGGAAAGGALLGVWLLGPLAYGLVGRHTSRRRKMPRLPRWARPALVLLVLVSALLTTRGRFDGDPRHLLPASPDIEALQQEFSERYGGFGTGGMVVTEAPTLDAALDAADQVETRLSALEGADVAGRAAVLPGPALREARRGALPDTGEIQAQLDQAAAELGFTPGALGGAAARALTPPTTPLSAEDWAGTPLAELVRTHVQPTATGWSVMSSLVAADDTTLTAAEQLLDTAPGQPRLFVPTRLARQGVHTILNELTRLGPVAFALMLVLLWVRFRRPRLVLAAMVPVVAAVVVAGGVMAALDIPWNAVSSGAMVLILGLGLDYGVFVLEGARHHHEGPASFAVGMSALTTIGGFGILAVADAPALYTVGVSVLAGMTAAGLSALVLVPPLARREPVLGPWLSRVLGVLGFLVVLGVNLDTTAMQFFLLSPPPHGPPPSSTVVEVSPAERAFGPNRLLRAEGIWTAYFEGSAYQRGFAEGALEGALDTRLEAQLLQSFEGAVPSAVARYAIERGTAIVAHDLDQYFPMEERLEIAGFADRLDDHYSALAPAYTRKIYYHAVHDIGQALVDSPVVVMACTGFIAGPGATANGHWILGRDFDFDGGDLFDRDKIVTFVRPDEGIPYVSISFAGMTGVMTGLNQRGLGVAIQAGASAAPIRPGMPMTVIVRQVLEHASSLDEAEKILRRERGFVAENVLVVDGNAGEAVVFEVSPTTVVRLPVDESIAVANHFRAPEFADDPVNIERQATSTTVHRQRRLEELLAQHRGAIDMEVALDMLSDRLGVGGSPLPRGHRWTLNADIATHSAVIDATARVLRVSRAPNISGGYVEYDLDRALAGDITPIVVRPAGDTLGTLQIHQGRALLRQAREAPATEAEALARHALRLMPDHPEALEALAVALARQGRWQEARGPAQQALDTPPEYGHQADALRALLDGRLP